MRNTVFSLLCLALPLTSIASAKTVEVGYNLKNFYDPGKDIDVGQIRVVAENTSTGDTFEPDSWSGTFLLPIGIYTFSGSNEFCFIAPATVVVTEAKTVSLSVGCE
ncbi:MAG: hypothetical protein M3Q07_20740 [Pseudobdellovibrionaceae bacterium]|nr:hypothetical protein [Pseudobdellovibrionaceae bacterium]